MNQIWCGGRNKPAGSTLAPDDTAELVVSEAERRVSQQIDGRVAALVVTTPTAFSADAASLLVARLSQRYRGRRIDIHPAECAAAEFAVQTGALTPDGRVLVVVWRAGSLDLAVVRWSARQFKIVSQPFMDESLPTGAAVTTGTAQIDLATLRAAFATVSSAADSPVTVALLVGSAASSDAVRNAISATLPSTRVATVADDTVVLGGASGAALLALSPRESPLDYPDAAAPVVDDDVQSPSTGRAASIPENGEGFSFSLTRPKPSNRTACGWIPFNRECDVFQLYWSSNSMTSDLVSNEWHFALALNRPGFIRPVHWGEAAARIARAESPAAGVEPAPLQLPAGTDRAAHAGRAELSGASSRPDTGDHDRSGPSRLR